MKKKVIITFDYEVFLGRKTGSVEKSILKPTEAILKVLKENKARAIFFVDATWLLFIKEYFKSDFQKVKEQLKAVEAAGSSVELHLHPQWREAEIKGNDISFDPGIKYYTLHSLSDDQLTDLFRKSAKLLEDIKGRPLKCFRAGGWCIEPFERLKSSFEDLNIKFDFSVAPGMQINEKMVYDYDYTDIPALPAYRFQNSVKQRDPDGMFIEVPVSTYMNNAMYRLLNKAMLKFTGDMIFGDGTSIKEKSLFGWYSIAQHLKFSRSMFTIDKCSHLFFRFLMGSHLARNSFLVLVSHPKIISGQALKNLSYLCRKTTTLNSDDLDLFFERDIKL